MSSTDQHVVALFKQAAWEVDRKKFESVDMDKKIAEYGIDSVAMLEVIGYLEEELDIHLPDEKIARVQTLRDLATVIGEINPDAIAQAGGRISAGA